MLSIFQAVWVLTALSFALLAVAIAIQCLQIRQTPKHIPWVGLKDRIWFAKLRACMSEVSAGRSMAAEGYEKYGKHGEAFVLPGLHWPAVVLPPSDASWIASQTERSLSAVKALDDMIGFDYLSHGPNTESVHDFSVIIRDLTRQIGATSPSVLDELALSLEKRLGNDPENWKEVKLAPMLHEVSFEAVNRIFVGLPLSRDPGYRKAIGHWTVAFGASSAVMRFLIPRFLRPWLMPALSLPAYLMQYRAARYLLPEIRRRLKLFASQDSTLNSPPNDMIQWILAHNATKSDPAELAPMNIAGRLILFNIFATVTTPTVAGLVLIDLLSHDTSTPLLASLRAEAARQLPHVATSPNTLRAMPTLDSAIRETLRVHPMGARSMMREVVAPVGLTAPGSGTYLPQGSHVETLSSFMQCDAELHGADAGVYDPLRFHRLGGDGDERHKMAVQINDRFLSWGLGKHACPGRFFAVNTMKLLIGCLLLRYDIEPLKERPKMFEFSDAVLPGDKITIRVRRRKDETFS